MRYDHEALIGILALEAHRAGALVVGEDLGVVEPWVRDYLRERGMLGTSILWFEKDEQGRPLPAESYRELCLATVTTHDLPPTAGYLAGEHIDLREELGLLTRPVEQEREVDAAEQRGRPVDAARARAAAPRTAPSSDVVEALHRFLTWTPARLIGVSRGRPDRRPPHHQPARHRRGVPQLAAAAGRRRTATPVLLEDLMASRWARRLARTVAQR